MSEPPSELERRRYRRVSAPILVRPASLLTHAIPRPALDVSLGGLRAYSDEAYRTGARVELELQFPDAEQAQVLAEVVWVQPLPAGAPARFDVGLRFIDASEAALARIRLAMATGEPG